MKRATVVKRSIQRGMTIVEIMVVVAIIGLVMGAVAVGALPALARANCKTAWTETQNIQQAVAVYQTDNNGECPKSIGDLVAGKYLTKDPKDPWNQIFGFKCPGDGRDVDVWSKGKDKQEGTEDDIKGWGNQNEQCKK